MRAKFLLTVFKKINGLHGFNDVMIAEDGEAQDLIVLHRSHNFKKEQ